MVLPWNSFIWYWTLVSGNCYLGIATTRFTLLLCCIRIAQALYACVYVRLAYYYVAVHPSIIREQVLTALRREYCFPVRPGGGRACIYPRAVVPPFQPICILVQQFHETSRASTRSHDDILVRLDGARQFARCFLLRGSYRHEDDTVWVFFLLFAVIDYKCVPWNIFSGRVRVYRDPRYLFSCCIYSNYATTTFSRNDV